MIFTFYLRHLDHFPSNLENLFSLVLLLCLSATALPRDFLSYKTHTFASTVISYYVLLHPISTTERTEYHYCMVYFCWRDMAQQSTNLRHLLRIVAVPFV
jgi:hypothetical protein